MPVTYSGSTLLLFFSKIFGLISEFRIFFHNGKFNSHFLSSNRHRMNEIGRRNKKKKRKICFWLNFWQTVLLLRRFEARTENANQHRFCSHINILKIIRFLRVFCKSFVGLEASLRSNLDIIAEPTDVVEENTHPANHLQTKWLLNPKTLWI
jgi:hypothetical protein